MMFCDTHIHLLAPEWSEPAALRINSATDVGIGLLLQPGVRASGWEELIDLARHYPSVYAAPGLHPMCAADWSDRLAAQLRELCLRPEVVAIGEIGLDGMLEVGQHLQKKAFREQLEIAISARLPVLIHSRKSIAAVLKVLKQFDVRQIGGILHGFSGSLETARQAMDLGLLIGVGPVLLRENARKLPEVIKAAPADMLVLETDAPDMAKGPEVLLRVAAKVAALRGWTLEETAHITTANAIRLLKIQDR